MDLNYPDDIESDYEAPQPTFTMINPRFKTWFIALMLLAFMGQTASALAMPCQMMDDAVVAQSHEMSAMDHDMSAMNMDHDMPMDHVMNSSSSLKKAPASQDCCKLPGHCASGSCSTMGFAHQVELTLTVSPAAAGDDYLSVMPATLVSSLFRPPIFR